ncbi:MAG: tRNA (N(6)-L-threonylcarbamoyladenosine(37)-C(2))-methylthiotransferase MtaB [Candidatus Poribacteria bacterium]|nr:tRNA (N(6)-L-threonylcarbamoyladenosine(37)-C(2))-methylthiotransferase MtaB [Candidatus Poribacteria bacterium]
MSTAALITLGCKVNQYDTQAMQELLLRNGYTIVAENDPVDVYIINTCTVTNVADQKARQVIRRAIRKNPDANVLVTGCYAESDRQAIEQIPGVSLVFGNREKADLQKYLDLLHESVPENSASSLLQIKPVHHDAIREHANFGASVSEAGKHTRALIKVQDGCSAFCTYCIIPYVRGRMTSRPLPDIVREAKQISANGYKEIVITGVHLGAYGLDIRRQTTIADILESIHPIDGIERIRFSSIEPMNFPDDLVDRMAALPKCMPHFHLPLQAGSDKILRQMRRRYTTERYMRLVEKLRASFSDVGITTDVMVGFPGETDADFEESLRFVEEIGFSQLHVFRYSPRRGTPAADCPDQVPPHVSAQRSKVMIALGKRLGLEFRQSMLGKTADVLVEDSQEGKAQHLAGFTGNYLRVLLDLPDSAINQILPAKLVGIEHEFMTAEVAA